MAKITSAYSFQRSSLVRVSYSATWGLDEAVQIEIHQRQAHHVGRDVVAFEVGRESALLVGGEGAGALVVGIGGEDVLVGGNQESGGAAGRVEDGLVLLRIDDGDDEVDDVARGAELPGVALGTEDREQVLEGVAEALAVVIGELVDDLEKGAQGLRVAVGQVGVVEDVAEQWRDARVFRHPGDGLGVEIEGLLAAETGAHQPGPAVAGEVAGEEGAPAAQLLAPGVDVVHELIDEGDGDLLHLALGIGHLAHEDVAGGVDAASGFGVEHK